MRGLLTRMPMGMMRAISSTMRQKMKKTLLKKRIMVTGVYRKTLGGQLKRESWVEISGIEE